MSEIEALATYAHDAWAGWMRHMFKAENLFCVQNQDPKPLYFELRIDVNDCKRWTRQMRTPYADLPEDEKESDRKEARKILGILEGEKTLDAIDKRIDMAKKRREEICKELEIKKEAK